MDKQKKTYCNPLDLCYRYQHINEDGKRSGAREGADPTLILFKGRYYLFVSMSAGFWHSEDLLNWEFHANEQLLIYDYAPDVRQIGDYLYFCASRRHADCPILRTLDPLSDGFEQVSAPFAFWDPDIFCDDDGRVYFYWGCTNTDPIYGVEMDPDTMLPIGETVPLIWGRETQLGYERPGDNGEVDKEGSVVYQHLKRLVNPETGKLTVPEALAARMGYDAEKLQKMFDSIGKPYIEGAFMTKHQGKYYLQYACPGTEYNTYSDGVYVSDSPLGPFTLQASNPFSSKPGGFAAGAGHGSTIMDKQGNYWHAATMRISVNHSFERRVGLFPAGFDQDGELFCNQNYGDWPIAVAEGKNDPWREPQWYLLNYAKPASCSSFMEGKGADQAVNEDSKTWWRADSPESGQWLEVDLEKPMDVRAIQINFADDNLPIASPGKIQGSATQPRYIEERDLCTRWKLEGSLDGKEYFIIEDKSQVITDIPHDFIVREDGIQVRFVRLTVVEIPYDVTPCISGLRVFGIGTGQKPQVPVFRTARSENRLDLHVTIEGTKDAVGYNILWGHEADKLYHSYQIYRDVKDVQENRDAGM